MYIVFTKSHDIHKAGEHCKTIERTMGAKLCALGVAIPYTEHLQNENLAKARVAKAEADAEARGLKIKAAEEAKAAADKEKTSGLLKNKKFGKKERAVRK